MRGLNPSRATDSRSWSTRDRRRRAIDEGSLGQIRTYNIIDETDLVEAVAKRFGGQLTANKRQTTANTGTPTAPPSPLSFSAA